MYKRRKEKVKREKEKKRQERRKQGKEREKEERKPEKEDVKERKEKWIAIKYTKTTWKRTLKIHSFTFYQDEFSNHLLL